MASIEAMKKQDEMRSSINDIVKEICSYNGELVNANDTLTGAEEHVK